jgi:hypothetical protein
MEECGGLFEIGRVLAGGINADVEASLRMLGVQQLESLHAQYSAINVPQRNTLLAC